MAVPLRRAISAPGCGVTAISPWTGQFQNVHKKTRDAIQSEKRKQSFNSSALEDRPYSIGQYCGNSALHYLDYPHRSATDPAPSDLSPRTPRRHRCEPASGFLEARNAERLEVGTDRLP